MASNAHMHFGFSGYDYWFLLWDADSNGILGLGWACNGYSRETDKFKFTAGASLSIGFKLIVTNRNAYFYFGDNDGNYTLEVVYINVPVTESLNIGTEGMAARIYDMHALTKLDDEAEYGALVMGEEFDYYESETSPDGLYISFVGRESDCSVIRDGNRISNYIDTSSTFTIEGIGNADSVYRGITRDWKIVSGGSDLFSGERFRDFV